MVCVAFKSLKKWEKSISPFIEEAYFCVNYSRLKNSDVAEEIVKGFFIIALIDYSLAVVLKEIYEILRFNQQIVEAKGKGVKIIVDIESIEITNKGAIKIVFELYYQIGEQPRLPHGGKRILTTHFYNRYFIDTITLKDVEVFYDFIEDVARRDK